MSEYYLVKNPPRRDQFTKRSKKYAGLMVVHTAESGRGKVGSDRKAWDVASFIKGRSSAGSYHTLVDSRNIVKLVPLSRSAYHCRGWNSVSVGLSVACDAAGWATYPDDWVDAALDNLARAAIDVNDWARANRLPQTPGKLITADEARRGIRGFTSHGMLDPGRRSDPGPSFPWNDFLAKYNHYLSSKPNKVSNPMPTSDPYNQPNNNSRNVQDALNGSAEALGLRLPSLKVDGYIGAKSVEMARAVESASLKVVKSPAPRDVLPHEVAAVKAVEAIRAAVQVLP